MALLQTLPAAADRGIDSTAAAHHALAAQVVQALVDEVTLSPKPGLVDRRGNGAHSDLSWGLMCRSANALRPSFAAMAQAGASIADRQLLRECIGLIGRQGEAAMMAATGGVNTHRGAIWALGLLVTTAAQQGGRAAPDALFAGAAALARTPDRFAPKRTGHKGELACIAYQVGGARSQAENGFPLLGVLALPALRDSRRRGEPENAARLNALVALMSALDDTCVLSRGGPAALQRMHDGAADVLAAGGVATIAGRRALRRLDADLLAHRVSPGGAGDLLAATLFVDRCAPEAKS